MCADVLNLNDRVDHDLDYFFAGYTNALTHQQRAISELCQVVLSVTLAPDERRRVIAAATQATSANEATMNAFAAMSAAVLGEIRRCRA